MPPITSTRHTLPFDKLSPLDFERMCLWLVQREGFERAEHLGASGSEQGRDIVAWKDGKRFAFQCKRVRSFGPKDAAIELARLSELSREQRPDEVVLLVTCNVSADARSKARSQWRDEATCHIWAVSELDERVKRHEDILAEFFAVGIAEDGRTTTQQVPGAMHYAVFISYANRHQAWAKALQENLNLCDDLSPVFLDQVALSAGRSWIAGLQAALDCSARLVLVGSPEAFASPWVRNELDAFLVAHPHWKAFVIGLRSISACNSLI